MKRVAHPTCVGCGKLNPEFESARLKVRVCYGCLLQTATGFHRKGMLFDSHILVTELFEGVFSGGVIESVAQMPVVVRSELGSSTFSFLAVDKYVESDIDS